MGCESVFFHSRRYRSECRFSGGGIKTLVEYPRKKLCRHMSDNTYACVNSESETKEKQLYASFAKMRYVY
jgi:hypothetical protein